MRSKWAQRLSCALVRLRHRAAIIANGFEETLRGEMSVEHRLVPILADATAATQLDADTQDTLVTGGLSSAMAEMLDEFDSAALTPVLSPHGSRLLHGEEREAWLELSRSAACTARPAAG